MIDFPSVMTRARGGDPEAIDILLTSAAEHLQKSGKTAVKAPLQQRFSESDAVQDTLMTIYRSISGFRGSSLREWHRWVDTIAGNAVRDAARRHLGTATRDCTRQEPIIEPLSGGISTPSVRASRKEEHERLMAAVESLPEDQQQAFRLKFMDRLTLVAVAKQMNQSEHVVAGLLRKAVLAIRRRISG